MEFLTNRVEFLTNQVEFPNQSSGVPNQSSGVPNQSSGVPNQSSGVPNQSSGVPNQSSGVPNQSSGVPNQSSGVPNQSSGVPNQSSGVPNQSSGVPNQSSGVPNQSSVNQSSVNLLSGVPVIPYWSSSGGQAPGPGPHRRSGAESPPLVQRWAAAPAPRPWAPPLRPGRGPWPCELVDRLLCWSAGLELSGGCLHLRPGPRNRARNQPVAPAAQACVSRPGPTTVPIAHIEFLVLARRYRMQRCALELRLVGNTVLLLNFRSAKVMRKVANRILALRAELSRPHCLREMVVLSDLPHKELHKGQYTERWRRGEISNFDYLLVLNYFSGRSLNDLTQYPVFPWIVQDFKSNTITIDTTTYSSVDSIVQWVIAILQLIIVI